MLHGITAASLANLYGKVVAAARQPAAMELVRMALLRRVYTQAQADYIIECFAELMDNISDVSGLEITHEPPLLRHFTASLRILK